MRAMKLPDKWKFAIGTTSRVPDSTLHYLIADFDTPYPFARRNKGEEFNEELVMTLECCPNNYIWQKTTHGWHLYTDWIINFERLPSKLLEIGADPEWIEIGKKRGYYFLADKTMIIFPWPVEHMVINYGKEKAQNSKRS